MPVLTLAPNGTITPADLTIFGGSASAHAAVADGTNATYIRKPNGTSFTRFQLDTATVPAGARVKRIRWSMNARTANPTPVGWSADDASVIDVWLQLGDPSISTYKFGSSWGLVLGYNSGLGETATSFPARVGPWSVVAPSFGQTAVDVLEVRFRCASANPPADISLVRATVDYMTQPSVSVSAPTGTIGTTRPVVTWAHTQGTDGGPQSHYQLRIYDSATYSGGGFVPGQAGAVYVAQATGGAVTLTGDASSRTATVPGNGTYRAYVRTAQSYNDQPHWSDWAYSQFTVNTTPATMTLAATVEDAQGRVRLDVTRTGAEAWSWVEIERQDPDGSWVPVRGVAATVPGANSHTFYDYEAQTGGVFYRGRAMKAVGPVAGSWVSIGALTAPSDLWLISPTDPARNVRVCPTTRMVEYEERPQGVFWPLGSRMAVTVSGPIRSYTGELTVETDSDVAAAALRNLVDEPVVLVRHAAAFGIRAFWASLGDIERRHMSALPGSQLREWRLSFVEVAAP